MATLHVGADLSAVNFHHSVRTFPSRSLSSAAEKHLIKSRAQVSSDSAVICSSSFIIFCNWSWHVIFLRGGTSWGEEDEGQEDENRAGEERKKWGPNKRELERRHETTSEGWMKSSKWLAVQTLRSYCSQPITAEISPLDLITPGLVSFTWQKANGQQHCCLCLYWPLSSFYLFPALCLWILLSFPSLSKTFPRPPPPLSGCLTLWICTRSPVL